MRGRIEDELARVEDEYDARILYAAESGSRAWGFASTDSNWDVRFLYVRRRDWYLSIEPRRDVIEKPISDALDINGWDVPKALRLLRKGNAVLPEWLASPLIYAERGSLASRLRELVAREFRSHRAMYHYHSMARKSYREYLRGDSVRTKKYFYVLRPLLACHWIERESAAPPMEFRSLVEAGLPDGIVRDAIEALLVGKRSGEELDAGPRLPVLNGFIETELERIGRVLAGLPKEKSPAIEPLNELFREVLEEAWDA